MNLCSTPFFCLFAQTAPAAQSRAEWMAASLGWFYGLAIPLTGLLVFIGACFVVKMSKRPAVIASYLLFLPAPMLIGIIASIHGMINSMEVIVFAGGTPEASAIGMRISMALFSSFFGMFVSAPSYLVLSFGLFIRTVYSGKNRVPLESAGSHSGQ